MNYIGSKHKLSDFIYNAVKSFAGKDLSKMVFCDLFAGTGAVGRKFKPEVAKVISNDLEYYSYILNKNYIENNKPLPYEPFIEKLNKLKGKAGFIFNEYAENGKAERLYFKESNGRKIEAVRQQIEKWFADKTINVQLYYFLLASLLESADKVANTASVYGAYLKHIKKSAQKDIIIEPATFAVTQTKHKVYNEDCNKLITKIEGDILYLDPPYNAREYGANYHLLNTIAKYDSFTPAGKTGLRKYATSDFCKKGKVAEAFDYLIKNADFKYIFVSYNNEGLMSGDTMKSIMQQYGKYDLVTTDYQRFKADKTANRNHKASKTTEYLHILIKK